MSKRTLEYDPLIFLRCHSNKFDLKTDIQTKVWYAEFEPDLKNPDQHTNIVATAGGSSICLIDLTESKVKKKYCSTNSSEVFYCITWMPICLDGVNRITVLVAGSSTGRLHIICPDQNMTIGEVELITNRKKKKPITINSLCPYKDVEDSPALLCGLSDGSIVAVELKSYTSESTIKCDVEIFHNLSVQSEVFQIAFCPTTFIVLAACSDGLRGIFVPSRESFKSENGQWIQFNPSKDYQNKDDELSDTVQIIGNGLFSLRYAQQGSIYIIDLKPHVEKEKPKVIEFTPKYVLQWSDTDNYFMNIGLSKAAKILALGDDKGAIWLYDLSFMDKAGPATAKKNIPPTNKLDWPVINDKYSAQKKKLKLDVYEIVINKVAVHSSGKYIVGVTDNNTVCMWKRYDGPDT